MPQKTSRLKETEIKRCWYLVNAENRILGRLASKVATVLMGKDKPTWSPNQDTGDFVVVINAEKIRVTGQKLADKKYYRHSGYLGGLKEMSLYTMLQKRPERVIELAVKGMVPKNALGRRIMKKLKVYRGSEHPHEAQNPQLLEV
ncbi:MAG TPA: 50S ribosomal protein L13 [bacterium]|nr:50S ribosomal protein L13 [bacterium]HOL66091.1 50S ribosomal protein L13 [bacterium]HPP12127.1 50S ribosomal protein L13 [bacterium]